jgi:predicted nucleic acid-binding protein
VILVDTSVWIDHLRARDDQLVRELNGGTVLAHSFVIGEVALGQMRRRREILANLQGLRRLPVASDSEVLWHIEARSL